MATIDTISDLMRVLDTHPEWLEAMRARLLTSDVLEMPRRLEAYVESTNRRLEAVERLLENHEQRPTNIERLLENHEQRPTNIERLLENHEQRPTNIEQLLENHEQLLQGDSHYFTNVYRRLDRQSADTSFIKGELFERRARRLAQVLTYELGLAWKRTLTDEEILEMISSRQDTSGIDARRLYRLRRLDLTIEAVDQKGSPCYIAGEVSYTVDERDTVRAIDGARLLTGLTGLAAHAVVVGTRKDDRIQCQLDAGEVFYWELEDDDLLPR